MDFQDMRLLSGLVRFYQLRDLLVDFLQELDPFLGAVALVRLAITTPVAMSNAANRSSVPCRT